jgi:hypothetical protein
MLFSAFDPDLGAGGQSAVAKILGSTGRWETNIYIGALVPQGG